MSLEKFLALTDDKILEAYDRKEPNIEALRSRLVKRIDKAIEQFGATEPVRGRKMFGIKGDKVSLTVPLFIGKKERFGIPSERFLDAMSELKKAINAGQLDSDILARENAYPDGLNEKADKPNQERKKRQGWTPEERERRATAAAARKAAKNA